MTFSPNAKERNDDEDDRWGPWAMQDEPLPPEAASRQAGLSSSLYTSTKRAAPSPRPADSAHTPERGPGGRHPAGRFPEHRAAAVAPYAAPARESGAGLSADAQQRHHPGRSPTPPPLQRQRQPPPRSAQADALAFDELWGGRASAWDIAALRHGLVTQYAPGSPPRGARAAAAADSHGTPLVHGSASQDHMSDLGGSVGTGTATEYEEREEVPVLRPAVPHAAAAAAGPPLIARSMQDQCEVPLWLPDSDGTVAAMGTHPTTTITALHGASGSDAIVSVLGMLCSALPALSLLCIDILTTSFRAALTARRW